MPNANQYNVGAVITMSCDYRGYKHVITRVSNHHVWANMLVLNKNSLVPSEKLVTGATLMYTKNFSRTGSCYLSRRGVAYDLFSTPISPAYGGRKTSEAEDECIGDNIYVNGVNTGPITLHNRVQSQMSVMSLMDEDYHREKNEINRFCAIDLALQHFGIVMAITQYVA